MSSERHQGSQLSNSTAVVKDLSPKKPVPPTFQSEDEWNGFQGAVVRAFRQGLLPSSIGNEETAIILACKGRELGLEPLYALSVLYLVQGKPSLEGEAMLGLVFRRYKDAKIEWIEQSHEKAVLTLAREGGAPSKFEFTVQDALRAGILEKINPDGTVLPVASNNGKRNWVWAKYTKDMLMWRAVARAVRFLFPECIQGVLTPDELSTVAVAIEEKPSKAIDSRFVDALPPAQSQPAPAQAQALADSLVEALLKPDKKEEPAARVAAPREADEKEKAPIPLSEDELFPFEKKAKTDGSYMIRFGSLMGKKLNEIPKDELNDYLIRIQAMAKKTPEDSLLKELILEIEKFL